MIEILNRCLSLINNPAPGILGHLIIIDHCHLKLILNGVIVVGIDAKF